NAEKMYRRGTKLLVINPLPTVVDGREEFVSDQRRCKRHISHVAIIDLVETALLVPYSRRREVSDVMSYGPQPCFAVAGDGSNYEFVIVSMDDQSRVRVGKGLMHNHRHSYSL